MKIRHCVQNVNTEDTHKHTNTHTHTHRYDSTMLPLTTHGCETNYLNKWTSTPFTLIYHAPQLSQLTVRITGLHTRIRPPSRINLNFEENWNEPRKRLFVVYRYFPILLLDLYRRIYRSTKECRRTLSWQQQSRALNMCFKIVWHNSNLKAGIRILPHPPPPPPSTKEANTNVLQKTLYLLWGTRPYIKTDSH